MNGYRKQEALLRGKGDGCFGMKRFSNGPLLVCFVLGLTVRLGGAAIIYVVPDVPISISMGTPSNPVNLDLSGDGFNDFSFIRGGDLAVVPVNGSRVITRNHAAAALVGMEVEEILVPSLAWSGTQAPLYTCGGNDGGVFCLGEYSVGEGILGVEFLIGVETHYGWVSIDTFPPFVGGRILEWAYESEPGVGIMAGAIPEPSAVHILVLGAGMLLLLRRRR